MEEVEHVNLETLRGQLRAAMQVRDDAKEQVRQARGRLDKARLNHARTQSDTTKAAETVAEAAHDEAENAVARIEMTINQLKVQYEDAKQKAAK